jgi:hypothetical protein
VRPVAALAAVLALLAAGCGGGGDDDESSADGAAALTVTVWPDGAAGDSISWTLECDPPGGDHPDPEAACASISRLEDPFGEVPEPDRCDEIPGEGTEVATVTGTFRGGAVDERFTRENACVQPRWDRIAPLFPAGPG